jgi:pimeloyl-ACP methyl ester carboxylesterase
MKSIYTHKDSKEKVIDLYDRQLNSLEIRFEDIYVDTCFGRTHIIKTGNENGKPLLLFHGGNATSAYNLIICDFLLKDFAVYAVDIIGHPGKSAEVCLPSRGYDYGKWASSVIECLGFHKMLCCAGSFGAGIIAKLMCYAPEKVERVVLYIPSGIHNALAIKSFNMAFPMMLYWLTGKKSWMIKCILPMSITADNIDDNTYQTVKCIIDNVKIKMGMPSNVKEKDMKRCKAPTLVMAAEKDCLFPEKLVMPRAKSIIPNCSTYVLQNRGHLHLLTEQEKEMMIDFLND